MKPIAEEVPTFPKGVSPKVSVILWLEFELSHNTIGSPLHDSVRYLYLNDIKFHLPRLGSYSDNYILMIIFKHPIYILSLLKCLNTKRKNCFPWVEIMNDGQNLLEFKISVQSNRYTACKISVLWNIEKCSKCRFCLLSFGIDRVVSLFLFLKSDLTSIINFLWPLDINRLLRSHGLISCAYLKRSRTFRKLLS